MPINITRDRCAPGRATPSAIMTKPGVVRVTLLRSGSDPSPSEPNAKPCGNTSRMKRSGR